MLSFSPLLMLANSSVAWHKNVSCPHYAFPYAVPNVWECKGNVKNEQLAKLAKRAELPRVKREYASNCRAPIWHRVEVGRAQLDRVKQARVKKDAPKWTDSVLDCISFNFLEIVNGCLMCCAIPEETVWSPENHWLGVGTCLGEHPTKADIDCTKLR